ncbi:MAG TPA: RsmE family RNA methyltransferase [Kiritimatiellia bacterium]|nr:RsmE family RNA methyltransferase [Kiritimatiellia bacterium]
MNLILLAPAEIEPDGRAVLVDERGAHARDVLRVAVGDAVRVGVMNGPRGRGRVVMVSDAGVELACTFEAEPPPRPRVDLLLALPRPKVMKRLWAQLAALGVGRILLTNAARVERNYFDTHVIDRSFFNPLLIEGLQQAQDTRLSEVSVHRRFKPLIEDELSTLSDAEVRLVLHPAAVDRVADVLPSRPDTRVLLAIGPEGGWVPYELELLAMHGFRTCTLGVRTLRSDTACIAALACVHDRLGAPPV